MGTYFRLVDEGSPDAKEKALLSKKHTYTASADVFKKLPGTVFAYWGSKQLLAAFEDGSKLEDIAHPRKGLATTDNNRFLRQWFEIDYNKLGIGFKSAEEAMQSGKKWFPLNKGGQYRKWYGNNNIVINWFNNGAEIKELIVQKYNGGSYTKEIRSEDKYFLDGITWCALTGTKTSFRYTNYGALFDSAGSSMFTDDNIFYLLGLLNSKVINVALNILNPTLNFGAGTMSQVPICISESERKQVENIVERVVDISKTDWNEDETSWDFRKHPLI